MTLQHIMFPRVPYTVGQMIVNVPKMQKNWLKPNVFIQQLKLERLSVYVIESNAFNSKQFCHLKVLKLVHLQIRILWSEIFAGLDELVELYLESLQIQVFQPYLLAPLKKLEFLYMNGCIQKETSLYNLFGTTDIMKLVKVDILGCNLKKSINHTTFSGLKGVVKLGLSTNKIQGIGEHAFNVVFGTLKHLDLSSNHLTSLPGKLFQCPVPHAHNIFINLYENPWHCDYKLDSLVKFIKQTARLSFSIVICKTPAKFAGNSWILSLREKEINKFAPSLKPAEGVEESHENGRIDEVDEGFEDIQLEHSKVHIKMECKISNPVPSKGDKISNPVRSRGNITLTKPSKNMTNFIQMCNGELFINAQDLTNELQLIGFEYKLTNTNDSLKSKTNDILKCTNIRGSAAHKYGIGTKLQQNRLYRFCIMKLSSATVTPLNCELFWLHQEEIKSDESEKNKSKMLEKFKESNESRHSTESDDPGENKTGENESEENKQKQTETEESEWDAWILEKDRITMMIAFVLSGLYGFFVGLFISVGLVKVFPTLIPTDSK